VSLFDRKRAQNMCTARRRRCCISVHTAVLVHVDSRDRARAHYVAIMLSRCKVAFADVCQMVMLMDDRLTLDLTAALLQFVPQQEEVLATSI